MFSRRDLALLFIFLGLFCILTPMGCADDKSFLVTNSRSPDGKFEIWIKPINTDGIAAGKAEIREVNTGKVITKFDWSGFGVKLIEPNPPFDVFWRKDSRYFAIKYEITRGWVTGGVYGRNGKADWVEIKMPRDEYGSAIKKEAGIKEFYGKGCDAPKQWLKNGKLELVFIDRNLCPGEMLKENMVELKVADKNGEPLQTAEIVTIKSKSE